MVLAIYLSAQFRQPFLKLRFCSFWRGREAKTKEKVAGLKRIRVINNEMIMKFSAALALQ